MKLLVSLIKSNPLVSSLIIHIGLILILITNELIAYNKDDENSYFEGTVEFVHFMEYETKTKEILDLPTDANEEKIKTNLHSDKMIKLTEEDNLKSNDNLELDRFDKEIEEMLSSTPNIELNLNIKNESDFDFSLKDIEENLNLFDLFIKEKKHKEKASKKTDLNKLTEKEIYIASIQNEIYRKWDSSELDSGLTCELYITQNRDGFIEGFNFYDCNNNEIKKSAIKAISSITRLPYQEDFSIFESTISISFISN